MGRSSWRSAWRSQASLAPKYSLENGGPAEKGRANRKASPIMLGLLHSSAGTCSARRKKQKNIIAMRTVEFNQALGGREGGAQLPPLPPAPPNPAHTVPLRRSARHQQKGTFLIS